MHHCFIYSEICYPLGCVLSSLYVIALVVGLCNIPQNEMEN